MAQYSAREVAEWFLAWADDIEADISNLKLQKLLYYAQGHYLARKGVPLFNDKIQAWAHGPVVPAVYHSFKEYGRAPIDPSEISEDFDWDRYKPVERFLMEIWDRYGSLAAWTLREKTHREAPWKDAFEHGVRHTDIEPDRMQSFFAHVN